MNILLSPLWYSVFTFTNNSNMSGKIKFVISKKQIENIDFYLIYHRLYLIHLKKKVSTFYLSKGGNFRYFEVVSQHFTNIFDKDFLDIDGLRLHFRAFPLREDPQEYPFAQTRAS